jgi:hypothetical protein
MHEFGSKGDLSWESIGLYPQFSNELHTIVSGHRYLTDFERRKRDKYAKDISVDKDSIEDLVTRDKQILPFEVLDDEHELWTDLILLNSGSPYSFADFDLPPETEKTDPKASADCKPTQEPTANVRPKAAPESKATPTPTGEK